MEGKRNIPEIIFTTVFIALLPTLFVFAVLLILYMIFLVIVSEFINGDAVRTILSHFNVYAYGFPAAYVITFFSVLLHRLGIWNARMLLPWNWKKQKRRQK